MKRKPRKVGRPLKEMPLPPYDLETVSQWIEAYIEQYDTEPTIKQIQAGCNIHNFSATYRLVMAIKRRI